jgi:hypothetical protein
VHSYSGNPNSYPPLVDLGENGIDNPTFATWNLAFEALADRTAFHQSLATVFFRNSYAFAPGLTPITAQALGYDPINIKWMVAGNNSTANICLFSGRGDPLGWLFLGGGPSTFSGSVFSICRGIEPAVTYKYAYAAYISSGNVVVVRADTAANAFTSSQPAGAIADALNVQLASVSGAVAAFVGSTNLAHCNLYTTIDHGATWTTVGGPSSTAFPAWLVAQSVPGGYPGTPLTLAIPVTDVPSYYSSTDCLTWTLQNGLGSAMVGGSTETPTALCYGGDGAGQACWIVASFDTSGNHVRMYRSYDGVAWSAFSAGLTAISVPITRFAALGAALVGMMQESSPAHVLYSLDGGATWNTTNVEAIYLAAANLGASNNQFLLVTDEGIAVSNCYGSPLGIGGQ